MRDERLIARAREIADDLLFPRALETDAAELIPRENLDALAAAGLYGITGPRDAGGLDADTDTYLAIVETLAGACLATTFVWFQHPGVVRTIAGATAPLRDRWLAPMCRGDVRAGIALGGLLAHAPGIAARRETGGGGGGGTPPPGARWGGPGRARR